MHQRSSVREQINIRASAEQRELIDRAAELLGRNRTDFMLESVLREAEHVLLEQRLFRLDASAFDSIADLLDNPPVPNAELRTLLNTPAPWE
jgi:uncharacterized protein (DUF1778 family)